MRPQFRCSPDPSACIASGSIAILETGEESEAPCPVCGRPLRVRGRFDVRSARTLARLPNHRRADSTAAGLTRRQAEKLLVAAAIAERKARAASARRSRQAGALVTRAIEAVGKLPRTASRDRRLQVLHKRAAKVARWSAPKPPRGAGKTAIELMHASGIDPSAVEPGEVEWLEHIATVLDAPTVKRLRRVRPTKRVYAGIVEMLKRARPKTWADLEDRHFAGQLSFNAFLRAFPGLESVRLPPEAIDAQVDRYTDEVPF